MDRWTREQVLELAPDVSSARAGEKLSAPAPWSEVGTTPTAVWGQCQGSGKRPYQTVVELAEPAYTCSCPSRKFPCKHALGLLLLWSGGGVPDAQEPADFAAVWLESRGRRREQAVERAAAPKDPERAARTAAQRTEAVAGGIAELRMWLLDQVHGGLSGMDGDAYARVDPLARRLVDAKAPGLAARVRRLPQTVVGAGWPDRLLREFGLLWMLTEAHSRLDSLPEEIAATVRRHVGYPVASADVLAGPAIHDSWTALGRTETVEENVTTRRTWLHGEETGRWAVILDFKVRGGPSLPRRPAVGATEVGPLAFHPDGLRALIAGDMASRRPAIVRAGVTCERAREDRARRCAADPWVVDHPVLLAGTPADADTPHLVDRDGLAVPLRITDEAWWTLLAVSGGSEVVVAGLLDATAFVPLSVLAHDKAVAL
ncbi:SWIM zinc finger family protein [Tsukamurella sp. NPDC003166]|uniref:SWIM zinc finger family protein n=1 Tax=Tsukamurella sp. NPDC003166 TaxID=3154444 RepID=UPI0033A43DB8